MRGRAPAEAGWSAPARPGERGAVTVEAAVTLLGVAFVLVVLVWFLVVLVAQLRASDAAHAAARLAARAQPYADVRAEAHRVAPGLDVDLDREGDRVVVVVRQRLVPPLGPLAPLGAVEVSARASARLETAGVP